MKKKIGKTMSIIAILTMTFQFGMPMIPVMQSKVLAADMTIPVETENIQLTASEEGKIELSESVDTTETEEISKNYEIKDEETWDISANGDGSVIAKWTLNDKTLTISGTGEMKDWASNLEEDWHNTQYTNIIESVSIEEGITNIGNYAFSECSNLKNIKILENLVDIGQWAFYRCSSLENMTIPEKVTNIGIYAFRECISLESITIPEGVTNISSCVFEGCISLKSIEVDEDNKTLISEDGVLFNKGKTEIIKYPSAKADVNKFQIPDTVTSIVDNAFERCGSLESITIPEGVTNIGNYVFRGCSSLKSIIIPEGVTNIGVYAFSKCSSLTNIIIPEEVTSIGHGAFEGCSSLTSINIPSSVTSIDSYTFYGCSSLESIIIPEGVISIGEYAFSKCSSLANIIIPEGVTSIEGQYIL